jgi:hypothetical protein
MKKLLVFAATACVLAVVDLYIINISPYIVAGIAAGWVAERIGA